MWRQRERIVGSTSCKVGAQRSQTVRAPGSSIAFKSALAADSVRRSASSITTTRQLPMLGDHEVRWSNSRISSILIESPSLRINSTSGWPPSFTVVQELHSPQPPVGQTSADAKASAASERPLPGGPVNNQACVISWLSAPLRAAASAPCNVSRICC